MPSQSGETVHMTRVVPNVFVRDVDAAVDFYVNKLGFDLVHRHDEPDDELAIVEQGDVRLNVGNCAWEGNRHVGNSFFSIHVDDVPAL